MVGVSSLKLVDLGAFPMLPPADQRATVYAPAKKVAANVLGGFAAGKSCL